MTTLLRLIRDHPDAVEHDLSRYHQLRWRRPRPGEDLTFTELVDRLRWLPPESATQTVLRDGLPHWSIELELLDSIRMLNEQLGLKDWTPTPHRDSPEGREAAARAAEQAEMAAQARIDAERAWHERKAAQAARRAQEGGTT